MYTYRSADESKSRSSTFPKRARKLPRTERLRRTLPYGMWTCADGRQLLFNRAYVAIWQRYPGQPATAADPTEWVPWKEQQYFFNDGSLPWMKSARATKIKCERLLADWGVVPPTDPDERLAKHVRRA
jgi:hypothetical protein